jgi:hypothetical protein
MKRVLALAFAICLLGIGSADAATLADEGTIIPTTDRSITDGRAIKCKQTVYGKLCYGLVPAPGITQTLSPYSHPWNLAANNYWGVGFWCSAPSVQIIWINEPTLTWLGAATMDGCWTNTKYVWLNAAYPNISIAGASNSRSWCAIVVHEWGHLIGLRWEYCPSGWVHECTDPNHIMYYRGINHIPAGC